MSDIHFRAKTVKQVCLVHRVNQAKMPWSLYHWLKETKVARENVAPQGLWALQVFKVLLDQQAYRVQLASQVRRVTEGSTDIQVLMVNQVLLVYLVRRARVD